MNNGSLKKTFLMIGLFLLSLTLLGNAAFADDDDDDDKKSSKQLVVTEVHLDFARWEIAMMGKNFVRKKKETKVTLGGSPLTVLSYDNNAIYAELPDVDAGDYLLEVSTGKSTKYTDVYHLTIGAVGPAPAHEWKEAEIRFENPDGTWGEYANLQGPVGPQGPQGLEGQQGPQGEQGLQGLQGEKGDKGDRGPQGLEGQQGAVGAKGDKGDTGAQGTRGLQGEKGEKGDTGAQGAQGQAGPQGPQGQKGDKGDPGDQGPQGLAGQQGVQGLAGADGAAGAVGPQGPKGDKGDTGDRGPQGSAGPQGAEGATGAVGPTGQQGPQGVQGPVGPQGTVGPMASVEGLNVVGIYRSTDRVYDLTTFGGLTPDNIVEVITTCDNIDDIPIHPNISYAFWYSDWTSIQGHQLYTENGTPSAYQTPWSNGGYLPGFRLDVSGDFEQNEWSVNHRGLLFVSCECLRVVE